MLESWIFCEIFSGVSERILSVCLHSQGGRERVLGQLGFAIGKDCGRILSTIPTHSYIIVMKNPTPLSFQRENAQSPIHTPSPLGKKR